MLETAYGGTSAPLQLRTFPREMVHVVKSTAHLLAKVNRTAITRLFPSHSHKTRPGGRYWPPFVTPEFRALMDPHSMYSRKIYAPEALADLLQGPDEDWYAHESLILKLANIEMLCRELDFEPDADFLVPSAGDRQ